MTTEQVYLELTFLTLAMLVIGGPGTSLWAAVVGALVVSGVDAFLVNAEESTDVLGRTIDLPEGTRLVVLGTLMALALILRPSGITGGREVRLPRRWRTPAAPSAPLAPSKTLRGSASSGTPPSAVTCHVSCM